MTANSSSRVLKWQLSYFDQMWFVQDDHGPPAEPEDVELLESFGYPVHSGQNHLPEFNYRTITN